MAACDEAETTHEPCRVLYLLSAKFSFKSLIIRACSPSHMGTHDENDGTGMAIRLRCLDVLEWVLLMMAWDADKSQDLFEDDCLHLLVGSGPHNSEATPYHWDIATCTLLWIQKTIITVYQKYPQGLSMLERSFQHDPARNNARDTFWRVIYKTSESYLASSSLSHCLRIDNKL